MTSCLSSIPLQQELFPTSTRGRPLRWPNLYQWLSIKLAEDPGISAATLYNSRPPELIEIRRATFNEYFEKARENSKCGWMHGRQKQRVRAESKAWAAQYLDILDNAKKIILSLPYNRVWETIKYFDGFPHVGPKSKYLFFEKNMTRLAQIAQSIKKQLDPTRSMLIAGDILRPVVDIVPDKSVIVFDLDLMGTASASNMKKIRSLIEKKADPSCCYIFINTSYGRSITLRQTQMAHDSLRDVLSSYFLIGGSKLLSISRKYRDSYPMYATSMVIRR